MNLVDILSKYVLNEETLSYFSPINGYNYIKKDLINSLNAIPGQLPMLAQQIDSRKLGSIVGEKLTTFTQNMNLGKSFSVITWQAIPYITLTLGVATLTVGCISLCLSYGYDSIKKRASQPKLSTEYVLSDEKKIPDKKGMAIFASPLKEDIDDVIKIFEIVKTNKGFFPNILLYGPGGTGKTMIGKQIAEFSGMDYIRMSGGDLAQYIAKGEHVSKLNELMEFVKKSKRPIILFIDEAEALVKTREDKKLSSEHIELLNAFLSHTGQNNKNFSIIMATNRIQDIDEAVLTRLDIKLDIPPPKKEERKAILSMHVENLFKDDAASRDILNKKIDFIAEKTEFFTGRMLFKLVNMLFNTKCCTSENKLTEVIIEEKVSRFCANEKTCSNSSEGKLTLSRECTQNSTTQTNQEAIINKIHQMKPGAISKAALIENLNFILTETKEFSDEDIEKIFKIFNNRRFCNKYSGSDADYIKSTLEEYKNKKIKF